LVAPDPAAVRAPGPPAHAARVGELAHQLHAAPHGHVAAAIAAVLRLAAHGLGLAMAGSVRPTAVAAAPGHEFGPAAAVDPHAAAVPAPVAALHALRARQLAHQGHAAAGVRRAMAAAAPPRSAAQALAPRTAPALPP